MYSHLVSPNISKASIYFQAYACLIANLSKKTYLRQEGLREIASPAGDESVTVHAACIGPAASPSEASKRPSGRTIQGPLPEAGTSTSLADGQASGLADPSRVRHSPEETLVDQVRGRLPGAPGFRTPGGEFKPSPAHRSIASTAAWWLVAKTRQAHASASTEIVHAPARPTRRTSRSRRAGSSAESGASHCAWRATSRPYASKQQRASQPPRRRYPLERSLAGGPEGDAARKVTIEEPGGRHRPTIRRHFMRDSANPVVGVTKVYGDFPRQPHTRQAPRGCPAHVSAQRPFWSWRTR